MKLISINIELNKHYDAVLNFLKQEKPDVVCLQELLEYDFERFTKELNLNGVFRPFKYVFGDSYKEIVGHRFGVAIFSNSIIDSNFCFYEGGEENAPKLFEENVDKEINRKNSVLLSANIKDVSGKIVKIITTHPPVTKEGESSPYQLEVFDKLLKVLKTIPDFVMCGDMNAPRGNQAFRKINEYYIDNIPLEYKTSIDQNLHKVKDIQFMVDCLFSTPNYVVKNVKLVDGVSDHMAIVADIE